MPLGRGLAWMNISLISSYPATLVKELNLEFSTVGNSDIGKL